MAASDFYEVLDPRFGRLFNGNARVNKLYTGCRWAEGPAYFAAGRYLVWSDIPNDRMLRYDETSGQRQRLSRAAPATPTAIRSIARAAWSSCEHGGRRVSRTEFDGSVITLADTYKGKKLNSPNDVVVKSDGRIWFTDPSYGIDTDYEGNKAESEIGGCHVYRVDPRSGAGRAVVTDIVQPNGIAFSPDEKELYIVDTGATHQEHPAAHPPLRGAAANKLQATRSFAKCTAGLFDGFRFDTDGHIWTSAADGVHCYEPDGTLIGKVQVPEVVANVCFGGPKRNYLYICGTTSLYAVRLKVNGAKTY